MNPRKTEINGVFKVIKKVFLVKYYNNDRNEKNKIK